MKWLLLSCLSWVALSADTVTFPFEKEIESFIEKMLEEEEEDADFVRTSHTVQVNGHPLHYTAITGTLRQYLTNSGESSGRLFFTAYLKDDAEEDRPLTFIFNGGPGGSSLSMHITAFGPRRILLPEEGQPMHPPYKMIDNPETLLEVSDLILLDPMETGYSRMEETRDAPFFWSVDGDLYSVAEFVRMFCIHFDRWNSPKYMIGASYGTCRACGLAEVLAWNGIHLNGIVLLSCAFDYNAQVPQRDAPLSDCLNIPTFAATAWYHGRTFPDKTVEEVTEYARKFMYEQYIPAMMQPARLTSTERRAFYQRLADLIGLPVDTIRRYQGRIDEQIYTTEFLATERQVIGGLDSRYVGDVSTIASELREDPSYRNLRPAFYPSFLHYLQTELETKMAFPHYFSFNPHIICHWDFATWDNFGPPNFLQKLRRALIANPEMKVFVGSGYYDIRTPFAAAEYALDHLELPDRYKENFQVEYYKAGHAFIFDLPSLKKFRQDLFRFYGY